jgi:hypothetical protein
MSSLLLEGLKIGFYVLLFFSSPFFLGEGREREIKKMHFSLFFKRIFCIFLILEHPLPTLSHKKRKKGEEKKRLKIYPFLQSSREDLILTGNDMFLKEVDALFLYASGDLPLVFNDEIQAI